MKLQSIFLAIFLSAACGGTEYASCGIDTSSDKSFDSICKESAIECKNNLKWQNGTWFQSAHGIKSYVVNNVQTPVLSIGYYFGQNNAGINILSCAKYPAPGIVDCKMYETFYLEKDWVPF